MKSESIRFDLCKFPIPMVTLRLYILRILKSQRVGNLGYLQQTDAFKTQSCNSELVSKKILGFTFNVASMFEW